MTENRKELIEQLSTSISILTVNKIKCDFTIVGGFAISLLYEDFSRPTIDIDILTEYEELEEFGFSLGANEVIENFEGYKENRILLSEFSSQYVSVYVLKPELLLKSKEISNRLYPDKEDIEFLREKMEEE